MRHNRPKLDLAQVESTTSINRSILDDYIKSVLNCVNDFFKKERLQDQECKRCYYLGSRIGGAAMTEANCGICDKITMYSSTCTDRVCKECAKKHRLCCHCGGDLEMKRRKEL